MGIFCEIIPSFNDVYQTDFTLEYVTARAGVDIPMDNTKTKYALGSSALHDACIAIKSGIYNVCLVAGFEKMTSLSETTMELLDMFALNPNQFNAGFVFSSVFSMMMSKYFRDYARKGRRVRTSSSTSRSSNEKSFSIEHLVLRVTRESI